MKFKRNQSGFSLVELMIVVAIIGVLAALAVPKFSKFQAKARQAEVKNNLNHIYQLQVSYHGDNDTYVALAAMGQTGAACTTSNQLGFVLGDCTKVRYTYSTPVAPTATAFTAQGTSGTGATNKVFPNCTTADLWTINENKVLSDVNRASATCN